MARGTVRVPDWTLVPKMSRNVAAALPNMVGGRTMSTVQLDTQPITGGLYEVADLLIKNPTAPGAPSPGGIVVLKEFAARFWDSHQIAKAQLFGRYEAWTQAPGRFTVAAETRAGAQLLFAGTYERDSGTVRFEPPVSAADAVSAARAAHTWRPLVAAAGGKLVGNNGDSPIYLFKMAAGIDAARVSENAKRNGQSEVVFTAKDGVVYVIQSRHLGVLPRAGDAIEIQDTRRNIVLAGTVDSVDAEQRSPVLVLSSMAAGVGALGLLATGVAPIVQAISFGVLTAAGSHAGLFLGLFAGGVAGLAGVATVAVRRGKPGDLSKEATEATQLLPFSGEWEMANRPRRPTRGLWKPVDWLVQKVGLNAGFAKDLEKPTFVKWFDRVLVSSGVVSLGAGAAAAGLAVLGTPLWAPALGVAAAAFAALGIMGMLRTAP